MILGAPSADRERERGGRRREEMSLTTERDRVEEAVKWSNESYRIPELFFFPLALTIATD